MSAPKHVQTSTAGVVRALPARGEGDDLALVEGLWAGEPWAKAQLYDRHAARVQRILLRVLGPDDELADVLQDTFLEAYASVQSIRDAAALSGWLSSVAVFTARRTIRRRKVRRWLRFWDPAELPDEPAPAGDPLGQEAMRRTYAILERLPADDRIAFSLRYIEGMKLTEVAESCGCSLATAKRWLARAERAFMELAARDPILCERVHPTGDTDHEVAS